MKNAKRSTILIYLVVLVAMLVWVTLHFRNRAQTVGQEELSVDGEALNAWSWSTRDGGTLRLESLAVVAVSGLESSAAIALTDALERELEERLQIKAVDPRSQFPDLLVRVDVPHRFFKPGNEGGQTSSASPASQFNQLVIESSVRVSIGPGHPDFPLLGPDQLPLLHWKAGHRLTSTATVSSSLSAEEVEPRLAIRAATAHAEAIRAGIQELRSASSVHPLTLPDDWFGVAVTNAPAVFDELVPDKARTLVKGADLFHSGGRLVSFRSTNPRDQTIDWISRLTEAGWTVGPAVDTLATGLIAQKGGQEIHLFRERLKAGSASENEWMIASWRALRSAPDLEQGLMKLVETQAATHDLYALASWTDNAGVRARAALIERMMEKTPKRPQERLRLARCLALSGDRENAWEQLVPVASLVQLGLETDLSDQVEDLAFDLDISLATLAAVQPRREYLTEAGWVDLDERLPTGGSGQFAGLKPGESFRGFHGPMDNLKSLRVSIGDEAPLRYELLRPGEEIVRGEVPDTRQAVSTSFGKSLFLERSGANLVHLGFE